MIAAGLILAISAGAGAADRWPQASGPDGSWRIAHGNPPVSWSVATGKSILWKTPLPEEGQSGIAVSGGRLFLTCMKPLATGSVSREGHDIDGYCLDARTGKILWTVHLEGSEDSPYAYGFSDSTSPSPLADGKHVWFFNASGAMGCWDFKGREIWTRHWKPSTGRPFNKQFEPFVAGRAVVNMEPRDAGDPKREADPWNYLRGVDKATGKTLWISEDALTHYNTPISGRLADGSPAVLQGRGGYHGVPEAPTGLTLTSLAPGQEGRALWRAPAGGTALYNMCWDQNRAYWLQQDTGEHLVFDARSGKLLRTQSLTRGVDYRSYDQAAGQYQVRRNVDLSHESPPLKLFPAWFTNIACEGYHYFLCFTESEQHLGPPYCVGRVNIATGHTEYLELPTQVLRAEGKPDKYLWRTVETASTVNSRGIDAAQDPRSKRDGWYWDFLGSPVEVNGRIYFTTMTGLTYVVDARATTLDATALLAVNDLGPRGDVWSLNSPSYAGGRLYHRTMRYVVCIGQTGSP